MNYANLNSARKKNVRYNTRAIKVAVGSLINKKFSSIHVNYEHTTRIELKRQRFWYPTNTKQPYVKLEFYIYAVEQFSSLLSR